MGPLVTLLTSLLTQAQTLVPVIVGFGLFLGGVTVAVGNHQRGKEGVICALAGGAVMLTALSIGASLHA